MKNAPPDQGGAFFLCQSSDVKSEVGREGKLECPGQAFKQIAVEGRRPVACVGDVIDAKAQSDRLVVRRERIACGQIKARPDGQMQGIGCVDPLLACIDDTPDNRGSLQEREIVFQIAVDRIIRNADR